MADYYEVLGVSRTATDAEIKKAYRKRARELHPDVAGNDPRNEELFKELANAYEVLGHADKRALYDRGVDPLSSNSNQGAGFNFSFEGDIFSDIFSMFGGGAQSRGNARARSRAQRGQDVLVHAKITLREAVFGAEKQIKANLLVRCEICSGSGSKSNAGEVTCSTCQGAGQIQQVTQSMFGQMIQQSVCPECRGYGTLIKDPCDGCGGIGVQKNAQELTVQIPAGARSKMRINFESKGNAGTNNGAYGDLYVEVNVGDDEVFTVSGHELNCKIDVPLTRAMLGEEVEVETLDGTKTVTIPVGSASGTIIRLQNLGYPKHVGDATNRGDLIIFVNVEMPSKLNAKQKKLIEELGAQLGDAKTALKLSNVQKDGFWSWIKKNF